MLVPRVYCHFEDKGFKSYPLSLKHLTYRGYNSAFKGTKTFGNVIIGVFQWELELRIKVPKVLSPAISRESKRICFQAWFMSGSGNCMC